MRRYGTLFAAVVIQTSLGAVYAWSAFVGPLRTTCGLTTTQCQVIFGVMIGTFALTMIPAGRLQETYGPRRVAAMGGLLYGAGYILASRSGGSFALLLTGLGVVAGGGIGLAYVCPLAAGLKCFPRHRGLVTGVAVAGFGGGAILISSLAAYCLGRGMDVLRFFGWMGWTQAVGVTAAAYFLWTPAEILRPAHHGRPSASAVLRQTAFWTLFIGMFSGTLAGLMVIGNLVPIGLAGGVSARAAAVAVSSFALGNAAGRIIWGKIYDSVGRAAILGSLTWLGLGLLGLLHVGSQGYLIVVIAGLVGFGFGACFVLYMAEVARIYGPGMVGAVYPLVFLAYGLSAVVGPPLGGWGYDVTGSYRLPIFAASLLALAGAVASHRLGRRNSPDPR